MPRWILAASGLFFVGLAGLGVVLPGLPTTPFLILAAGCFAKSSPRLYGWLVSNRTFGPLIVHWRENRSMPRRAKRIALISIVVVGGISVVTLEDATLQIVLLIALSIPLFIVSRIKTAD